MHRHIVHSLYDDTPLMMNGTRTLSDMVGNVRKHLVFCKQTTLRLLPFLLQTIDDLTFLKTAVTDCRKQRIPVSEAVFSETYFLVFRL